MVAFRLLTWALCQMCGSWVSKSPKTFRPPSRKLQFCHQKHGRRSNKSLQNVPSPMPKVIHGLLNNAGTFAGNYTGQRKVTLEGNEYSPLGVWVRKSRMTREGAWPPTNWQQWQSLASLNKHVLLLRLAVNVMAPFLLTSLLLENVRASGAGGWSYSSV